MQRQKTQTLSGFFVALSRFSFFQNAVDAFWGAFPSRLNYALEAKIKLVSRAFLHVISSIICRFQFVFNSIWRSITCTLILADFTSSKDTPPPTAAATAHRPSAKAVSRLRRSGAFTMGAKRKDACLRPAAASKNASWPDAILRKALTNIGIRSVCRKPQTHKHHSIPQASWGQSVLLHVCIFAVLP